MTAVFSDRRFRWLIICSLNFDECIPLLPFLCIIKSRCYDNGKIKYLAMILIDPHHY